MLLPYWTNNCIGSMEGLLFESSATTPYHFLNQSELSLRPLGPRWWGCRTGRRARPNVTLGLAPPPAARASGTSCATRRPSCATAIRSRLVTPIATTGPWTSTRRDDGPGTSSSCATRPSSPGSRPARTSSTWLGVAGRVAVHANVTWWLDPQRWDVYLALGLVDPRVVADASPRRPHLARRAAPLTRRRHVRRRTHGACRSRAVAGPSDVHVGGLGRCASTSRRVGRARSSCA